VDILVVVGCVGSLETIDELTKEELENVLSIKGRLVVSERTERRDGVGPHAEF
jgi:hypothetical protein